MKKRELSFYNRVIKRAIDLFVALVGIIIGKTVRAVKNIIRIARAGHIVANVDFGQVTRHIAAEIQQPDKRGDPVSAKPQKRKAGKF